MALLSMRTVKVLVDVPAGRFIAERPAGEDGHQRLLEANALLGRGGAVLACAKRFKQADTCFLAAFLMDAGMLALDQVLGEEYERGVPAQASDHRSLFCGIEAEALGMTHADVGALLAEHWHLPPAVRGPIAIHHQPESAQGESSHETAGIIWLAGCFADAIVQPDAEEAIAQVRRECADNYGIDQAACDQILASIDRAATELSALLGVVGAESGRRCHRLRGGSIDRW